MKSETTKCEKMYILKDEITGEIFKIHSKKLALEKAEIRVSYHNSEFWYEYCGKHMPENAEYVVDGNEITIRRKQNENRD